VIAISERKPRVVRSIDSRNDDEPLTALWANTWTERSETTNRTPVKQVATAI